MKNNIYIHNDDSKEIKKLFFLFLWLFLLQIFSMFSSISVFMGYLTYIIAFFFLKRNVKPFALFISGGMVIQNVSYPYGINGGIVSIVLVLLLLLYNFKMILKIINNTPNFIAFVFFSFLAWWFLSWLVGPRSSLSLMSFLRFEMNLLFGTMALALCLIGDTKKNIFSSGLYCLIAITLQVCISTQNIFPSLGAWRHNPIFEGFGAISWIRTMGMAVVMILSYCIMSQKFKIQIIILTLFCVAIPLFAADTRQVYIGLFVSVISFLLVKNIRYRTLILLFIITLPMVFVFLKGLEQGYRRYQILLDSQVDPLTRSGRIVPFEAGMKAWKESVFLGLGVGGFQKYDVENNTIRSLYPHNVILGILVDTGLIGLIIGSVLVFACLFIIYSRRKVFYTIWDPLISTWIYSIAIAMISGDTGQNTLLFSFPVATVMIGIYYTRYNAIYNK